jgi:hypothetical protein
MLDEQPRGRREGVVASGGDGKAAAGPVVGQGHHAQAEGVGVGPCQFRGHLRLPACTGRQRQRGHRRPGLPVCPWRPARGGVHPHGHGPHLRHGAGRPGGRGHQGRARGGRPHPPPAGRGRGLLPHVQPQQEEHCAGPAQPRRAGGGAQAGGLGRRGGAKLQARRDDQIRAGLRRAEPAQPAPHLREPQGLSARPLRAPHRAGRGGADDGRPGLHDRPPRRPAARGQQRQRHHGRHVWRHRRHGGADAAWHHRARAGGGLGPVREQRVPGGPAHDAVRRHRPACRAHARAHFVLGAVRRVHREGWRADLSGRCERCAVDHLLRRLGFADLKADPQLATNNDRVRRPPRR